MDAFETLASVSTAGARSFAAILTRGPLSRVDIARQTGLSQGAVTKAVAPMVTAGLVSDHRLGASDGLPGRPATPVDAVADALRVIGVKLNPDGIIAVVTDLRTRVVDVEIHALVSSEVTSVISEIGAVVAVLRERNETAGVPIVGVGVSVSGDVDGDHGLVRDSARMGWHAVDLRSRLRELIDLPLYVVNDVAALTVAEHWFGVGLHSESFALITLGQGIGCGLHLNGDVVEGAFGVAGEVGHLPLASEADLCHCGRRRCVEAVAGTAAITRRVSESLGRRLSYAEVVDLARAGDSEAVQAFGVAADVLGRAVASVANITGPDTIVISGEAAAHFDLFEDRLRESFTSSAFGAAGESEIVVLTHSFENWARGAAAIVIHRLVLCRAR